ncbi:DUF6456 domain-containing protein [uncultured Devosia sp.]|uniref:DUF6456 domain-containing protein n=1 Tax=uncultured Devosia sp. TaxID=211434 RepID=UPI0026130C5D|nr:DUF6456 domain-containing protein [uncultured Devosia sp.]
MPELPDAVTRLGGAGATGGFLEPHHLVAARVITRIFERASLRQRVTMSYDPTRIGGKSAGSAHSELALSAEDARQRLARLARQLSPDCWGVLCDVCIYDKGLQQIETDRGWPRRSAKLVLRIGLEQLAQALGLNRQAEGGAGATLQSWLPERPAMFVDAEN